MLKFSKLLRDKTLNLRLVFQKNCSKSKNIKTMHQRPTNKSINSKSQQKQSNTNKKSKNNSKISAKQVTGIVGNKLNYVGSLSNSQNMNFDAESKDQQYSNYRKWVNTEFGDQFSLYRSTSANISDYGVQFTLVSYNILAQDLLEEHSYLYRHHNKSALFWDNRLMNLKNEILTLQPQILCIQEVQESHLKQIDDNLKELNFNYIYKKKTGDRTDGCAIFYNKNIFNLIGNESVEYFQPDINRLDRHNVGLIAKFNLLGNPNVSVLIATTHLLYNPRRQDVRLAQIQVLLAELDRLSFNGFYINGQPRRVPIILSGDFNLEPHSAPFNLITKGSLCYNNLTHNTLEKTDDTNATLGNLFLSSKLGITDHCRHINLIDNRLGGETRLQNSELKKETVLFDEDLLKKYPNWFSTGCLTHDLYLTSAYSHNEKYSAGSTFQDKWITVDFIFYSENFNSNINETDESQLKLLSRYDLPNQDQCYEIGRVPNKNLGSDHLALATKFYLKLNEQLNHL